MQINERKSVSDSIMLLSTDIATRILNDAYNQPKKFSRVINRFFIEGSFQQRVDPIIYGISLLDVNYILYYFESEYDKDCIFRGTSALGTYDKPRHSWASYEAKRMQIVSYFVGGKLSDDFEEEVSHETTHIFQHDRGLKTNQELYNEARKLVYSNDLLQHSVGCALYYTFSHEQDAFVHQFYRHLCQVDPDEDSFEELLAQTDYAKGMAAASYATKHKDEAQQYINALGFGMKQWNYRMHYQYKRFRQKMYNAFYRYIVIDKESRMNEHTSIRHLVRINEEKRKFKEKYPDVEICIESIYQF